jgi:hypothetical protein
VCGDSEINRFLEGGSCNEVLRRLQEVKALAAETDEQLHVGGVIDQDFRTPSERLKLLREADVHVLGCHEVENLYLLPGSIAVLLKRAGADPNGATTLIRDCADDFAGLWVAQHAASRFSADNATPKQAITPLSDATRSQLDANWTTLRAESVAAIDTELQQRWGELLDAAWSAYKSDRLTDDWYRKCLGKQTLSRLAAALSFQGAEVLERHVVALWNSGNAELPPELVRLREYVNGLNV